MLNIRITKEEIKACSDMVVEPFLACLWVYIHKLIKEPCLCSHYRIGSLYFFVNLPFQQFA
jgi:hypothetical protein